MKTTNFETSDKDPAASSLCDLVDNAIKQYLNIAKQNSNSLINNVSSRLTINADETVISTVIRGLLKAVITHVKESHVYITAKELYGKMIEINIKDDNCYNTYAVALSLQDMVPLAEKIGGNLNITNQRQKITTISFRYPVAQKDNQLSAGNQARDSG
jgi:hypothetical protein